MALAACLPCPAQTHKRCMMWFKSLCTISFSVGDTTDLFNVEAKLMGELAELDQHIDRLQAAEDVVSQSDSRSVGHSVGNCACHTI